MTARKTPLDKAEMAALKAAHLRYATDSKPGISRRRAGKSWSYRDAAGEKLTDPQTVHRIRKLAIPPAYKDVWICADPAGHLQATGIDARGRKQYRYHPQWRQLRDATKYEHVLAFGRVLPKIRAKVEEDLRRHGLPREKVLATVVKLMETTLIRVGNEEYARDNKSYGLTTLRRRHVAVKGSGIHMDFKAKSGIQRVVDLRSPSLSRIIKRLRDLPGQELFKYEDEDGEIRTIGSQDVNDYLKEASDEDVTAKDFRTWAGTQLAAIALSEVQRFDSGAATKSAMLRAIEKVAERLGNTPSVCRKCYIHPAIFEAYLDGDLADNLSAGIDSELSQPNDLSTEEAAIMALLERRIKTKGIIPDDSAPKRKLREKLEKSLRKETSKP